jgi:uncharacterized membrane protein YfcA
LVGVGFVAGGLGALLGVGGGIILVPGLILVAGLPFHSAVAASLVCVVATSVSGSVVYLRRDRVQLDTAVELQCYTAVGAVLAGLAAAYVPAGPLYFAFAALLLVVAFRMLPSRTEAARQERAAAGTRHPKVVGASFGAGAVAGLLGVGGGILNVPILNLMLGLPFERALATSVYMIGVTGAAGALVYLARGDVAATTAGITMLGTLVGAALGARAADRVPQRALRIMFVVLLLYVSFRMARRGIAAF